jgi:hypothetical protein
MTRQLDFFVIQIPPCGRSSAPFCELEGVIPNDSPTCARCNCTVPGGVVTPSSW